MKSRSHVLDVNAYGYALGHNLMLCYVHYFNHNLSFINPFWTRKQSLMKKLRKYL